MSWSKKRLPLLAVLALGLIGGVALCHPFNRSSLSVSVPLPRKTNGPVPGANGVLAGQVTVEATGRPIRASIMIQDLDREEANAADLDLTTDDSGYFTIPKLEPGKPYRIIARADDNGELISRTMYVKPPNTTLLIRLDKRYTTAKTTPLER